MYQRSSGWRFRSADFPQKKRVPDAANYAAPRGAHQPRPVRRARIRNKNARWSPARGAGQCQARYENNGRLPPNCRWQNRDLLPSGNLPVSTRWRSTNRPTPKWPARSAAGIAAPHPTPCGERLACVDWGQRAGWAQGQASAAALAASGPHRQGGVSFTPYEVYRHLILCGYCMLRCNMAAGCEAQQSHNEGGAGE